jgi:hypothetical protein
MSFKLSCIAIALTGFFTQASATSTAPAATDADEKAKARAQQIKISALEKEMDTWARAVAKDGELSNNPLTRAMAQDALIFLQLKESDDKPSETEEDLTSALLSAEDKAALYSSATPMPLRLYHLNVDCMMPIGAAQCTDPVLAESLRAAEPNNAYIQFIAAGLEFGPAYGDKDDAQHKQLVEKFKRNLSVVTRFDDYSQSYKQPLLEVVKNRPLPAGWKTSLGMPIEATAIASAFPEEQVIAAMAPYVISMSSLMNVQLHCKQEPELAKLCSDAALLALKKPSNSLAFAGFLDTNMEHPLKTRAKALDEAMDKLDPQPTDFLKLDWVGLKAILAISSNKGDVAAIEPAFTWAEAQIAKLPQKSAEKLAEEAAAEAKREAFRQERNTPMSTEASKAASDAAAAAEQAAAEAVKAAAEAAAEAEKAASETGNQ